jgi:hypothetical protein
MKIAKLTLSCGSVALPSSSRHLLGVNDAARASARLRAISHNSFVTGSPGKIGLIRRREGKLSEHVLNTSGVHKLAKTIQRLLEQQLVFLLKREFKTRYI